MGYIVKMAVTILEANDLVALLHQGTLSSPPWSEFLAGLKRRTGSDYVGIWVRSGHERSELVRLVAGEAPVILFDEAEVGLFQKQTHNTRNILRVGRVYTKDELPEGAETDRNDFLNALMQEQKLDHIRLMRVQEPGESRLLIILGKTGNDFSRTDTALLGRMADHLEIALRTWSALEKERLRAGITSDAMRRLNFGWFLLDLAGRIVDQSDEAEAILQKRSALQRSFDGKLMPRSRDAQAALRGFLDLIRKGEQKSRAVHLSDEPWLDMLLTTATSDMRERSSGPIIIAFIHGEPQSSDERSEQLMELFGLTRKEALLALLISRGVKIAEAAVRLDLTIQTARLYSKRIYAKTDTRGQADLVRLILASIVALS